MTEDTMIVSEVIYHGVTLRFYKDYSLTVDPDGETSSALYLSHDEAPMECDIAIMIAGESVDRIKEWPETNESFLAGLELLAHHIVHEFLNGGGIPQEP